MVFSNNRAALLVVGALLATSACAGNNTVPAGAGATNAALQLSMPQMGGVSPDIDNTSILKRLKKDVAIGSTVDPTNGDTGPHGLDVVRATYILKKGQLVVCNFANKAGDPGKGTTIDLLDPTPGAKPVRFAQTAEILGCAGVALSSGNDVFAAGWGKHVVEKFNQHGKPVKKYALPIFGPFSDADAFCNEPYAPEDMYVADAKTGSIVKFADGFYGNPHEEAVVGGFAHRGIGWNILGPSGMQYDAIKHGSLCNDTLYVVDGVDNTVVAISNASSLLVKNEIVVQPGGKTFKCAHPKTTCASLVHSGAPLDAPYASAFLPNGNLIVANTKGGNKLVELTPAGKVLDVKAVDKSAIAHVFGLVAVGTTDDNTVLFYTTTADNTLHKLEP